MATEILKTSRHLLAEVRSSPFVAGHVLNAEEPGKPLAVGSPPILAGLTPSQLARHQVVLGMTGSGKSRYLELFARHLLDHLVGFTFIDPHGDTVESILQYATYRAEQLGDDYLLGRLHYLAPSTATVFRLDPFAPLERQPPGDSALVAANSVHATAERLTRAFLRNFTQAEVEVMVRLTRWLRNAMTGVGVAGDNQQRLSVADLFVLLDPLHDHHVRVRDALLPHLPGDVRRDFLRLMSIKRPQDQDYYTESSMNRLRAVLSPLVQAIFSAPTTESFSFSGKIARHAIVLVNLKPANVTPEQTTIIGGLLINELFAAVAADEAQRTPHHLIIDESMNFLGEDLEHILMQTRKWGLSMTLGAQSLRSFRKGELDLFEVCCDCCSTFISFAQRAPDTVEQLGKFFAMPNRILEERTDTRDRPDGYKFVKLLDEGKVSAISGGKTESETAGRTQSQGWQSVTGSSKSVVKTRSASQSTTHSDGRSDSRGESRNTGVAIGKNQSMTMQPIMLDGELSWVAVKTQGESRVDTTSKGESWSETRSSSDARGSQTGSAHAEGETATSSSGNSGQTGTTDSKGHSQTSGWQKSESQTVKTVPLAQHREEIIQLGEPRLSVPYQDAIFEALLSNLPDRTALCRTKGQGGDISMPFRTADCFPAYANSAEAKEKVDAFLQRLSATRPYLAHNPGLPEAEQEQRINAFFQAIPPSADMLPLASDHPFSG